MAQPEWRVLDPAGRRLPFGLVERDWLQRLLNAASGKSALKVATYIASRASRQRSEAGPFSWDFIEKRCGISAATRYRAVNLLVDAQLLEVEPAPRGRWLFRLGHSGEGGRTIKLFRAHIEAQWFREACAGAIQVYLAHASFSNRVERGRGVPPGASERFRVLLDGRWHGHWASYRALCKVSGLRERQVGEHTRWLDERAFRVVSPGRPHSHRYQWLLPVAK